MSFVKALIPGLILTFVFCIILGSNGSHGVFDAAVRDTRPVAVRALADTLAVPR